MQRWQRQEQQQHANNSEFVLNQPVAALSGESYSFHGPGSSARANLPLPTMFSVRISSILTNFLFNISRSHQIMLKLKFYYRNQHLGTQK